MKKRLPLAFLLLTTIVAPLSSCDFSFIFPDDNNREYTYYDLGQHSSEGTFFGKTSGTFKTLIVPVIIGGYESNATEAIRTRIKKAFFGSSQETGWESVSSYFKKCSYNKLNITGEVTEWFDTGIDYDELASYSTNYGDCGTYKVLELVYNWLLEKNYNLSDYDVNGDGYIDSIWMIYSCPHAKNTTFVKDPDNPYWAFTFWAYNYINAQKTRYKPVPNTYAWASYDFINEGASVGIVNDAHTYIHEHGHVMGLEDYYDYDNKHSPLGCIDMQDWNIGDHNAFSKLAWGWVKPKVVTEPCRIELAPTSTSGDCVLIKSNKQSWDGNPFSEYLIIDFVAQDNLWKQDSTKKYTNNLLAYTKPGLRIMHVDASLARVDVGSGEMIEIADSMTSGYRYTVARSNTPSRSKIKGDFNSYTSKTLYQDIISMVHKNHDYTATYKGSKASTNDSLFTTGDSFSLEDYREFFVNAKMHDGNGIPLKINFVSVTSEKAILEFVEE